MLEYWEGNCITHDSIIPLFHYSISIFLHCGPNWVIIRTSLMVFIDIFAPDFS